MQKVKTLLAAAIAVCAIQAQADLINGQLLTIPLLGNPTEEAEFVGHWTGNVEGVPPTSTLSFLAKFEPGSSGDLAGNFEVTGVGDESGTVSWDLTGTGWIVNYVLLKDGSVPGTQGSLQYYYLYEVAANQQLSTLAQAVSIGDTGRDISHITFLGQRRDTPGVPDGGLTIMLLGMGLAGMGAARRFISAR